VVRAVQAGPIGCRVQLSRFGDLIAQGSKLDAYYIPTRYPNGLPGGLPSDAFDADDARKAIAIATKLMEMVVERLEPGSDY